METIRDSAFGKLVRIFSGKRWLRYPEENDTGMWTEYLKTEKQVKDEEAAASESDQENLGLYTVLSQASRASRRLSTTSTARHDGAEGAHPNPNASLVIDWSGPDDPENPQNWTTFKKLAVSSLIWLLTFAIYIGSAIYTPGIPGVCEQFGVSSVAATLGLTLFVLGYGLGPMVWSPLSELPPVGRSPTYVLTLFVFVFFQFAVIYATNFGMLLAFRFLTGFIRSPALATGAASMGDIWNPKMRDYMIIIWGAFAISAPVLGPLVGGFAAQAEGWKWTIWQLLWVSAFAFVLLFFFLPETFAPNILYRRARRVRQITGNSNYRCEAEIEVANMKKKDIIFEALVRPFQLCFFEPIVLVMNLYIALIYGILYIWFEAFPIVFSEIHGFNTGESGLAFLGILISTCAITIPCYFWWKWKYQAKHFDENWNITPERQLPPACVGCFALPISLFWFGWTGQFASVHWIVPIIASMFFAVGGCLIFNCIFCYQAHAYPKYAASVLAGNDFLRSSFGAGFPLFASAMFHNLGVGWAFWEEVEDGE
ncbi:MFS transporter [Aspergillus vadensis CBS 113365]|uniref:Caffeine resistance protein 5 n=1 Tax=Aspergillus vadensis (strain CBS 113365 / IMI 142717 / IBT 24658) TaxID=1448311 RepID=A0A319AVX6_ASPVC|nr:caffeine resistance protein 5 [Aspergillus vadensis CBS 113365]PYH63521.1 caffeine resistance protein 5 [Aspergillus vadensis CBS 113365]